MDGLYPSKGSVAPGFDADLVLWNPNRKETIRQEILHHGADYPPYKGIAVTGWPVITILRGRVAMGNGRVTGDSRKGLFLRRALSPYAIPSGEAAM